MKKVTFYPMNMLIKGTSEAIKSTLGADDFPSYNLAPESTYNSEGNDSKMKTAKIVFELFGVPSMDTDKLPFSSRLDTKYLIMGDGENKGRIDGTYAIFKDFGESAPSVIYRFSKSNPHMEEFDDQYEVLEKVSNSFLDHSWSYEYEDYSCGEMVPYSFKGQKSKEIIALWNDDSKLE